jgi:PAS domain S-box-containing protein
MEAPEELRAVIWPILYSLPLSLYVKDRNSRFIYLNRATAACLGVDDPVQALGKSDRDFFEPSTADAWLKEEQEVLIGGKKIIDQIEQERLRDAAKPAPWVLTCKMPLKDNHGNINGLVGISKIITSTKQNMDRISLAVDYAKDGLWYRNYSTGEIWYSGRWKEMLGYDDKSLPTNSQTFKKLVFAEDLLKIKNAWSEHTQGKTPYYECVFRMKHRDGPWRWIHSRGKAHIAPNGKRLLFAGSHTDITEHKVQTDLYEQILELLPVLVFLKDKDQKFIYVNKEAEGYFNRSRDKIIGRTDRDVNPDETQATRFEADDLQILCKTKETLFIPEERLTHQQSGNVRRLQTRKQFLSFPSNDPQPHVLGVSTNITDTALAKEELRILRDSLAAKLKALTEMVIDIEKSGNEKDACQTAVLRLQEFGNILGFSDVMISFRRVIDGRPCIVAENEYATGLWSKFAPHTRRWCDVPQEEMDILPLVLENKKAEFVEDSRTHKACARGLAKQHNLVSQYIIPLQTPSLTIGTLQIAMGERKSAPDECSFYDAVAAHLSVAIERHRRLAELDEKNARLLRTSKLVAWSAAGTVVIHGLKHSLNSYLMILQRTEKIPMVRSCVPAWDFLKDTRRFVDHWAALFEAHLQSARTASEGVTALLDSAVRDVIDLAQPKAHHRGCRLMWKETVAPDLYVSASALYLKEMISVLVFNAIDAHAHTVRIEGTTINTTLPTAGRARSYARIRVCDDGHGIALEYQDQIGKFGWTSKKTAGHGVGLTIVATLAEALEGGLTLEFGGRSSGHPETVFQLLIPLV